MSSRTKNHAPVEVVTTNSKPENPCPARARRVHKLALANNWHSELRLYLHTYNGGGTAHRAQLRAHCGLYGLAIDWELPTWDSSRWEFHCADLQVRNTTEQRPWRETAHEFAPSAHDTLARVEKLISSSTYLPIVDPAIYRAAIAYDAMLSATRAGANSIPTDLRDQVRDAASECDIPIVGLNAAVPGARRSAIMGQRARRAAQGGA